MSIFINELAFTIRKNLYITAKVSILFSSLIAGIIGQSFKYQNHKNTKPKIEPNDAKQ